jgi:hypothetical protein
MSVNKDKRSYYSATPATIYTQITGTATGAGTNVINTSGYESLTFVIHPHTCNGTSTCTFSLVHGTASGTLTAVATSDLVGATSGLTITSGATGTAKTVGYIGGLQYVRLDAQATGTATGTIFSAMAILDSSNVVPTVAATA